MKPTLKISESVIKRLTNVHEPCFGSLYGVFSNKTQFIIGLCVNIDDENCKIDQCFPTEVELCGLFEVNEHDKFDHTKLKDTIENIIITDNPLYLKVTLGAKNDVEAVFILNHKLETANIETIKEEDLYSQFLHIRLKAQLPLVCSPDEDNIKDAIQEMGYHFEGKVIFHFHQQQVFLMEHSLSGMSSDCTVGDLHKHNLASDSSSWNEFNLLDIVQANMYKKVSQEINGESKKNHAPIVCVDKKKDESLVMVLNLDSLSIVHRNMPLKNVYEILVGSLYRNIGILQRTIVKHFQQSGGDHSKISYPEIFHFYPKACGHFITRVYAKNESECSLETDRRTLHGRLLLPLANPVLRRTNRFLFKGEQSSSTPIITNPHSGVKPTSNDRKKKRWQRWTLSSH